MVRSISILMVAALVLSGCARLQDSRLNPFNWFGASTPAPAATNADGSLVPLVPPRAQIIDGRGLVDQITDLRINRTPDGAIVTATAIASTQGQFNAQLVPTSLTNGVLTLAFRTEAPDTTTVGSTASRQITAARVLDTATLVGVRTIRVEGARNARAASR